MVRIIEKSQVSNKENFDKLYNLVYPNKLLASNTMLTMFAQGVLHLSINPLLMMRIHEYCSKYPYTMLVNN